MEEVSRLLRKKEKTRQTLIQAAKALVLNRVAVHSVPGISLPDQNSLPGQNSLPDQNSLPGQNSEQSQNTTLIKEKTDCKISIQEITDKADLGLGTFYNYFTSKQEIYQAVLETMLAEFRTGLDRIRSTSKDPAATLALTAKYCARENLLNEDWKQFIIRSKVRGEYYLEQSSDQCLEDILRGVKAGRFKVQDIDFARNLIQGMLRHVSREMNEGRMGIEAINETASCILRMLGLPDVVARAIVQAPLPPVAAENTEKQKAQIHDQEPAPHSQPAKERIDQRIKQTADAAQHRASV